MKIDLVRLWASPSTLHLRVVYCPDDGAWIRSKEIHCSWDSLPPSTRQMLAAALSEEKDEELADDPLF
jgi:hypothetical protein